MVYQWESSKLTIKRKIVSVVLISVMVGSLFGALPFFADLKVYADKTISYGVVDSKTGLNVRTGAGTNYSRAGILNDNAKVTITSSMTGTDKKKWYAINYGGKTRYIAAAYVDITSTTTVSPANTAIKFYSPNKIGTTNDDLNIRTGPSTKYKIYKTVSKGDKLTVTGETVYNNQKWYRVTIGSGIYYCSAGYVELTNAPVVNPEPDPEPTPDPEEEENSDSKPPTTTVLETGKGVTTEALNIRTGPSTKYSIYKTVTKGTKLNITGSKMTGKDKWYKISYSGRTLYVSAPYVKFTPDTIVTDTVKGVGTTTTGLNLRTGPSTGNSIYTSVAKGTKLTIVGSKTTNGDKWYMLSYKGKSLYASGKYIEFVPEKVETPAPEPAVREGKTTYALNLRTGPSTANSIYTTVNKGTLLTITDEVVTSGEKWYELEYKGKTLYGFAEYIDTNITPVKPGEAGIENFPESYQPYLEELSAKYPEWSFVPIETGINWSTAVGKQANDSSTGRVGRSLVHGSLPESYRSYDKGTYDFINEEYGTADGGWYYASDEAIAYYLDPRNGLTESRIFQFMGHSFDADSQTPGTVKAVGSGSFIETRKTSKGEWLYNVIYTAGKDSGVNPNVLAAMILQEQGTKGSSGLISGNYTGAGGKYKGYYNFFNIGAYNASGFSSAVHRGLWYASGEGKGKTSHDRPWKSVGAESGEYRSIVGGAEFYADDYLDNNQDSLYLKRFNVANGTGSAGTHQYMTNISGATTEGIILQEAYSHNMNLPITFYIPVYENMPANAVAKPSSTGNANNLLDSLTIKAGSSNISLGSSFDRYDQSYSTSTTASSITIGAMANENGAKVTGTGNFNLKAGKNVFEVSVKSTSGVTRTYSITVTKK